MWPSRALLGAALALGAALGWALPRPAAQVGPLPAGRDVMLVVGRCIPCHSLELTAQQRQDRAGWLVIVDRMISYGAPIPPEEKDAILEYLVTHFGR